MLVIELENSAEPGTFLHRACSVAIASGTTGVHIKRNTRAEFAKLKDIAFCQPTVNMRLEVLLACLPSTRAAVESQQALAVESPGKEQATPWKWLQWGSLSLFPLLFALGSSCSSA